MDAPEVLTKQVGPFPVYGWVGIFGAGIGIAMVLRKSDLFADEQLPDLPSDEDLAAVPSGPTLSQPSSPSGLTGATLLPSNPQPGPSNAALGPATNTEWMIVAIRWLVAAGVDPIVADSAVGKVLQGAKLDARESAAYAMVLKDGPGPPPEGAPPVQGIPTPVPLPSPSMPKPAPVIAPRPPPRSTNPLPTVRNVTVGPGVTLGQLALYSYGRADLADELWSANKYLRSKAIGPTASSPLVVGQVLFLPGAVAGVPRR